MFLFFASIAYPQFVVKSIDMIAPSYQYSVVDHFRRQYHWPNAGHYEYCIIGASNIVSNATHMKIKLCIAYEYQTLQYAHAEVISCHFCCVECHFLPTCMVVFSGPKRYHTQPPLVAIASISAAVSGGCSTLFRVKCSY